MFKKLLIFLLFFVQLYSAGLLFNPETVSAATDANCQKENAGFLGFPTWYKFLEPSFDDPDGPDQPLPGKCTLVFPRDQEGNESFILAIPRILLAVFEIILRIGGVAAVGFIIYGGIQYILSQGEPERTKASKNTIMNALIGLIIAMMSTVIVNLIGNGLA